MRNSAYEQMATLGGPAEKIRRLIITILGSIAGIFALHNQVYTRPNMGRRYFSLLGLFGTYMLIPIVYYVGWFIGYMFDNASSFKPNIVFDPMGMTKPAATEQAALEVVDSASPETMFFALKLFVIVACVQKILCQYRKMMKTEPSRTTVGGDTIFSWLVFYVPEEVLTRCALNRWDFATRHIEPYCCYFIGWLLAEMVDVLTGSLVKWCSVAMLIQAYCIRWTVQAHMDDMGDAGGLAGFVFEHKGETSSNGHHPVVRASVRR